MNKISQQFVAALIGVGGFCAAINDVHACGGRQPSGGYHRARPVVYSQPSYRPSPYPEFAEFPSQQPVFDNGSSQLPPAVRRLNLAQANQGQFAIQQQGQVQQGRGPQFAQQQQRNVQASFTGGSQGNALQSMGGFENQPEARGAGGGQPGGQQQQVAQGQPAQREQVAQAQQPQQSPAQNPMGEAQRSALQALADMGDEVASAEQAAPVDEAQGADSSQPVEQSQVSSAAGHVGRWKARLTNGSTVDLELRADGSFDWTAISSGKTSSFQGSYTLAGGALTLVRSSDNQKLAGSLSASGNGGMNFKLNGAKDNGLNFVRS